MLLEQASDGIVMMDPRAGSLEVNASLRHAGYAREELLGLSSPDVIAPADLVERPLVVPSPGRESARFRAAVCAVGTHNVSRGGEPERLPDGRVAGESSR
jgi:PAS domain S-box-containing protein